MTETFPFVKRYHYPHMKPGDVEIWNRFIEQFPNVYDHCQYDVPVGTVPEHAKGPLAPGAGSDEILYNRKIDVVAFKGDQIDIIEIKPSAGPSTIGQVKGYQHLYKRDYTPPVEPKAIVLTDNLLPDMGEIARAQGVLIVVV